MLYKALRLLARWPRLGDLMSRVILVIATMWPTIGALVIFGCIKAETMSIVAAIYAFVQYWVVALYESYRRDAIAIRQTKAFEQIDVNDPAFHGERGFAEIQRAIESLGPLHAWMPRWVDRLTNASVGIGFVLLITAIVVWVI